MQRKISSALQPIYDSLISSGNVVAHIHQPGNGWPLTIIFEMPLDRRRIESSVAIPPSVKWWNIGRSAGFVNEETGESIQGPVFSVAEVAKDAAERLAVSLQPIYELELKLGNTVDRIDEPAGSFCPLAIIFKKPIHKVQVVTILSLSQKVKWVENQDPHYPLEGGFQCDDTKHAVVGPLR